MVPRRAQVGPPTCGPTQARTTNPGKRGPRGGTSGAGACDPCAKPGTSGSSGERAGGQRRHSGPRNTLTDTQTHRHKRAHRPRWSLPHELQIPAGSGCGAGLRGRVVLTTGSQRLARWAYRCGVWAPLLWGRGPFSPRSLAPRPRTHCCTVGSPARALLSDPEPRPPNQAGTAGEGDGRWTLGPAALEGRRVCLLDPLLHRLERTPFSWSEEQPGP